MSSTLPVVKKTACQALSFSCPPEINPLAKKDENSTKFLYENCTPSSCAESACNPSILALLEYHQSVVFKSSLVTAFYETSVTKNVLGNLVRLVVQTVSTVPT